MRQGRERSQQGLCYQASYHCGQMELNSTGNSGIQCKTMSLSLLPTQRDEGAGVFIQFPFHCLRAAVKGSNFLDL